MILENRTDSKLGLRARTAVVVAGLLLLSVMVLPAVARGEGSAPAPKAATQKDRLATRLDRLQRVAEDLLEQVRALRSEVESAPPAAKAQPPAPGFGPRYALNPKGAALALEIRIGKDGRKITATDPVTKRPLWAHQLDSGNFINGRIRWYPGPAVLLAPTKTGELAIDGRTGTTLTASRIDVKREPAVLISGRPLSTALLLTQVGARFKLRAYDHVRVSFGAPSSDAQLAKLRAELSRLTADYQRKKAELEKSILNLEKEQKAKPPSGK